LRSVTKKAVVLVCALVLLIAETEHFGSQIASSVMRVRGERAFFRVDHPTAWRFYRRALALGGDGDRIETDMVELLLFGLDQRESGINLKTALSTADSMRFARDAIGRRLTETPYRAYLWSLTADFYGHATRQRRRETTLDLDSLSEQPLENLLPEDWLQVAALEKATRLEPNNYLYHDLLAEMFVELGVPAKAAAYCRSAVAAYPVLADHRYLSSDDLAPEILDAAVQGFEDATKQVSLVPRPAIECDAGRLLASHGQGRRAMDHFRNALRLEPEFFDARFEMALAAYQLGDYTTALEHFKICAGLLPESPWPDYYSGLTHLALGEVEAALPFLRGAREKGSPDPRFFYSLGESLESTGQVKEAERQFVAAAHLNPENQGAWLSLLNFHVRRKNSRAVAETCAKLLAMRPPVAGISRDACDSLVRTP
jgi:tetratricopeptide (TPR) repeat protein